MAKLSETSVLEVAKGIRQRRAVARAAENAVIRANAAELPNGKYRVLVIDPPWPMTKIERDVRPNQVGFDYPTMTEAELFGLRATIDDVAAPDCNLFLWTTQRFLPLALRLVEHYGFRYVLVMVWHKAGGFQPIGLPQYNCEFAIYARRGSPKFLDTKAFTCAFGAPRLQHSRKPVRFYDILRRVTAGPRLDMFSREVIDGFSPFGNETHKFSGA